VGHIISKISSNLTSKSNKKSSKNKNELYKSISEFKWKDANQTEIHQNSIEAYRKRFSF